MQKGKKTVILPVCLCSKTTFVLQWTVMLVALTLTHAARIYGMQAHCLFLFRSGLTFWWFHLKSSTKGYGWFRSRSRLLINENIPFQSNCHHHPSLLLNRAAVLSCSRAAAVWSLLNFRACVLWFKWVYNSLHYFHYFVYLPNNIFLMKVTNWRGSHRTS